MAWNVPQPSNYCERRRVAKSRWAAKRRFGLGSVLLFSSLLFACASPNYAPISGQGTPLPRQGSGIDGLHTVQRGETLYAIAWQYSLDFRGLARANGISPPYTIRPGQRLRLEEASLPTSAPSTARPTARSKTAAATPTTRSSASASRSSAAKSSATAAAVSKPSSTAVKPAKPARPVSSAADTGFTGNWRWPIKGKVLRGLSADGKRHTGIDIAGKRGEPVYAAEAGEVVYVGSQLVGLGKVVLVRHSKTYLSAYGHNSKLLVKEGQKVKRGQRIALVGDSGTDRPKLHFEIRKNGKPISPTTRLPKR